MSRNDVLVTADWAQEHLGDAGLVFVEVDEDTSAYDGGHLEGAVKLDWKKDLQDPLRRDFVDKAGFEALLSEKGISNDDTVILYGGNNNWFAAYAYWYFRLYGHQNVKLLDGGRKKWELDSRDLVQDVPSRPKTDYTAQEQAQRGGHIPTARNIPWSKAANDDGTFRSDEELRELYEEAGVDLSKPTIAYCRIGERSSHTWFALHELLGLPDVKNYDGSWTEYGSLIGVPIELGEAK